MEVQLKILAVDVIDELSGVREVLCYAFEPVFIGEIIGIIAESVADGAAGFVDTMKTEEIIDMIIGGSFYQTERRGDGVYIIGIVALINSKPDTGGSVRCLRH